MEISDQVTLLVRVSSHAQVIERGMKEGGEIYSSAGIHLPKRMLILKAVYRFQIQTVETMHKR